MGCYKVNKHRLFFMLLLLSFLFLITAKEGKTHFEEYHVQSILNTINDPSASSIIINVCKNNLVECVGGNLGTDASVVYYLLPKSRQKYYHGTHSLTTYQKCLQLVNDPKINLPPEKKLAFCVGMGTHEVQDPTSHGYVNNDNVKTVDGYTEKCIAKYGMTNIFLHAICEQRYTAQMMKGLSYNEKMNLMRLVGNAYDIFFNSDGTPSEYLKLLNTASGVDLTDAVKLVGANLKETCTNADVCQSGEDYASLYKNQMSVPLWWYILSIATFVLSLFGIIMSIIYGKGWLKIMLIVILIPFLILGGILSYFILFSPGSFFITFVSFSETISGFISADDYSYWLGKTTKDTYNFMQEGKLNVVDATGLSRSNPSTGAKIIGPLDKAETKSKIILYSVFIGLLSLILFLTYKVFFTKRKKK